MKEAQWADVRIKIMINNLYISMNEEKIKELPVSGSPGQHIC